MSFDSTRFCVRRGDSIRHAIGRINDNQHGIVLVVHEDGRLLGTVVDGDVRRAMLANVDLDRPVNELLSMKADSAHARPVTATVGTDRPSLLRLMQDAKVHQIPIIDEHERVVDLVTLDDLLPSASLPVDVVIMAGGQGTRLRPLTAKVPKPMLPVGEKPIMERIIEQLRASGIRRINIATNYLENQIRDYFQDGSAFGIELKYVAEDRPLGTAGAVGLFSPSNDPILVINGDIVTQVDFRAMLDYHREHRAELTVALRRYDFIVPYGVVTMDGPFLQQILEKPSQSFFVSAGIYLLEPSAQKSIPRGDQFDMTDLIQSLLGQGRRVAGFPVWEYWIDIGRQADYERAQQDLATGILGD